LEYPSFFLFFKVHINVFLAGVSCFGVFPPFPSNPEAHKRTPSCRFFPTLGEGLGNIPLSWVQASPPPFVGLFPLPFLSRSSNLPFLCIKGLLLRTARLCTFPLPKIGFSAKYRIRRMCRRPTFLASVGGLEDLVLRADLMVL